MDKKRIDLRNRALKSFAAKAHERNERNVSVRSHKKRKKLNSRRYMYYFTITRRCTNKLKGRKEDETEFKKKLGIEILRMHRVAFLFSCILASMQYHEK